MQKDIGIIIPHKGIGDLVFHRNFIKSRHDHHKKRVILFVNKSTKANYIYKTNKHIKKIIFIDLKRPIKIFYLFKILNLIYCLIKYNFDNLYYTGNSKWHKIAFKIISVYKKNKLFFFKNKQKYIITFLNYYLKSLNISNTGNFNFKVDYETNKLFIKKISNLEKPWAFLSIDTSEDQIHIPDNLLIQIIGKLKKKYKNIFINTNNKNSNKLNFLNEKFIIKTNTLNISKINYIIKNSNLFIGNESGPAVIASVFNRKSIIFLNRNVIAESSKMKKNINRNYFLINKVLDKSSLILDII